MLQLVPVCCVLTLRVGSSGDCALASPFPATLGERCPSRWWMPAASSWSGAPVVWVLLCCCSHSPTNSAAKTTHTYQLGSLSWPGRLCPGSPTAVVNVCGWALTRPLRSRRSPVPVLVGPRSRLLAACWPGAAHVPPQAAPLSSEPPAARGVLLTLPLPLWPPVPCGMSHRGSHVTS